MSLLTAGAQDDEADISARDSSFRAEHLDSVRAQQDAANSPDSEFVDCITAIARPIPKKSVMTRAAPARGVTVEDLSQLGPYTPHLEMQSYDLCAVVE